MAVKIRLSRHGKKNYAYFHIVVADVRAPRDGRLIEQIGLYNPNTNPATIVLDGERALDWLNKGAQPTTTARRILSYEGVLLKKHLQGGVAKGAFSEEEAERRFAAWKNQKDSKVASKKQTIASANAEAVKAAIQAEAKVNEERADAILRSGFLPRRLRRVWWEGFSWRAVGLAVSLLLFLGEASKHQAKP